MDSKTHEQITQELEALYVDMNRIRPRDGVKPKLFTDFVQRVERIKKLHEANAPQPAAS